MVVRQLSETQFERFHSHLIDTAFIQPLDASYTVFLFLDDSEYHVKLQLDDDNSIAVLQAIRVCREYDGPWFELITDHPSLSAFLDHLMTSCLS